MYIFSQQKLLQNPDLPCQSLNGVDFSNVRETKFHGFVLYNVPC